MMPGKSKIADIQVPDFKRTPERSWYKCPLCSQQVLREANGKEYYHGANCSRSLATSTPAKKRGKKA